MKYLIITAGMVIIFLFQRWLAEDGCSYGSFGALAESNWKPTVFSLICLAGILYVLRNSALIAACGVVAWTIIIFIAFDGSVERGGEGG